MNPDANAADSGALSVEQAVGLLDTEGKDNGPVPEQEQDTKAEPTAEGEGDPNPDNAGEEGGETEQQEEPAAIDPPQFWDAEAKKRFGELPPELQHVVLAQETQRNGAVSRQLQEAAEKRKAFEAETSRLSQFNSFLDKFLPEANERFADRWSNVDWSKLADDVGADQAFKLKAQYEAEQQQLEQLYFARRAAEVQQFQRYVAAETQRLAAVAPDLVDPKSGLQRRRELGNFLASHGYGADQVRMMSAVDASIAYDAMRWRQAQEKAKKAANPKPAAPQQRAVVKPTAAPQQRSSQTRTRDEAMARLGKTGRIDDAVAVLNARR